MFGREGMERVATGRPRCGVPIRRVTVMTMERVWPMMRQEVNKAGRFGSAIARGSVIATSASMLDLAVASVNRQSVFFQWELSWAARWSAALLSLVISYLVFMALAVPAAMAWDAVRGRGRAVRWSMAAGIALGWGAIFLGWFASWQMLHAIGVFPNANAVRMALVNRHALWLHSRHMYPEATVWGPVVVLLLALAATAVTVGWKPRWWRLHGMRPATLRRISIVVLFAVTGGYFAYGTNESLTVDPLRGFAKPVSQRFMKAWSDRSAPMTHLAAVLFRELSGVDRPSHWWRRVGIEQVPPPAAMVRPRRTPIRDYVRQVEAHEGSWRHWNVLVVIVESLRPDQLRVFGGPRDVMPNVDRLARRSLCWSRCYTQASHSNYADLCPLTSQYPLRSYDTHYYPADPPYPCIPFYDILHALGYRTAVISSQDERWGQMDHILHTKALDHWFHAGTYHGSTYIADNDLEFAQMAAAGKLSGKIDDAITIGEAIRWIESGGDRPFAAYINLQNSHIPYVVPEGFPRRFVHKPLDFEIGFNSYPPNRTPQVKDAYADSLYYVDRQLGRLFDALDRSGRLDSTMIVVTGDTGQAFQEHGFAAHANEIYDELMRVPLIVFAPGRPPHLSNDLAQHVDIAPTIFDLMGLPPFPSFQGKSLLVSSDTRRAFLVVQSPMAHQVGIVEGRWKLILDVAANRCRLYDLEQDPQERIDRLEEEPQVVRRLKRRLMAWCKAQFDYYQSPTRMAAEYPPRSGD